MLRRINDALSSPYSSNASHNTVAMLTAIPHAKLIPIRSPVVYLTLSVTNQTPASSTITAFIGVLGLKISAYLQPFTHREYKN